MSAIKESCYNRETGEYEFDQECDQDFSEVREENKLVRSFTFKNKENSEFFHISEFRDGNIAACAFAGIWWEDGFVNLTQAYQAGKRATEMTRKSAEFLRNYRFPRNLDF